MYVYTQDVPIDFATYRKVIAALGPEPLAGSLVHLCVRRPDGGLRYIEVWESAEACGRAFDQRIHAAVDKAFGGQRPAGEHRVEALELLHASGSLMPSEVMAG
ncbi:MAG: hypothetical protein ACXU82_20205 [Caulobacteraceae bacterium]